MTESDPTRRTRVVVAGGGIAAVEALLALRSLAPERLDVVLVAPNDDLHYRPFIVSEPFSERPVRRYRLQAICDDLGAILRAGEVSAVDSANREVVTGAGERIAYDALVIAVGARARRALPHALTFPDGSVEQLQGFVRDVEEGSVRELALVVPARAGWSLPIYELALMTAERARVAGAADLSITIVTPEDVPLAAFRGAGSDAVARLLDEAGVAVLCSTYVSDFDGRTLTLAPGGRSLAVDAALALPDLTGPHLAGVPCDPDGFVHVDEHGHVPGVEDVYAVGDATTFAIKQGGIGTQQADVAAALIAQAAGLDVREPRTRPVLRAILLTGGEPLYLTATIAGGESVSSHASSQCMWWPPHKIAARHLAPYLADREEAGPDAARHRALDVRLDDDPGGALPRILVAGGGVAGLEALLALHRRLVGLADLVLIAPNDDFVYRPLAVAEPFTGESVPTLPLADVVAEHNAVHVRDTLAAVDPGEQVAILSDGTRLRYDALVVAVGAVAEPVIANAIPLGSPADAAALAALVAQVRAGTTRRVALAVPPGIAWTLPLYEVALQLGAERGPAGEAPELVLVTGEPEPLAAFGADVAAETRDLLAGRGVALYTASTIDAFEDGVAWIEFEGGVDVDAVIALPRLRGPAIDGLPHDEEGFLAIDRVARVAGVEHVYAAGDVCAFPLKQGGIAAQEADVAAAHIAWTLGAGPRPVPLELVLRGALLTGGAPRFLRASVPRGGEEHDPGQVSREPLWWPPAKIAARELAPYLAGRLLPTAD